MKKQVSPYRDIERIGALSRDGVFIYNVPQRSFLYINKPFARIFNQTKKDILLHPSLVKKFLKAEDAFYLNRRFRDLMKTGSLLSTEFRLNFGKSSMRHISCDIYTLEHRKLLMGFVKDITNLKEHEDFIVNTGARKDGLLDMITHNLAGPLHLSKGLLQSLQENYSRENQLGFETDIKILLDTTELCIEIVNDFLKEEHRESAHIFVKKTRFDLIEKIKATLEKLTVTNPDKQFSLTTKLENLNISTDSVKFFQIIHNILSNAIKFTGKKGKIDIVVVEHKKDFTISVKDNGIGIPAKFHPALFHKRTGFRRQGLKGEKSSGLGLSIAKRLSDIIDGQIWFKSIENKGSVFSLRLPKE